MNTLERRQRLLREAFGLFLQRSYDAVSISDIVEAAGVSKGLLFYHFKSKEAVFTEAVDSFIFTPLSNRPCISDKLSSSERPLHTFLGVYLNLIKTRLQQATEYSSNTIVTPRSYFRIFISLKDNYPNADEKILAYKLNEEQLWQQVIQMGIDRHELKEDIDTLEVASIFINTYYGISFIQSLLQGLNVNELTNQWIWIYNQIKK